MRTIQSRYFEVARSIVARYGGTIEKFIGDAVMAVWGAPTAHEDDAERAVRAAVALVDAVGRLGGSVGNSLKARAAVTSGEAAVTVGAVGQGMVAGVLVSMASRLQAEAPIGGVLVDQATREQAGDAAGFEPVGSLALKGRTAPFTAFRVTDRAGAVPGRRHGAHTGPFVGRERELRELVELFSGVARDGRSRLVSVTGIAGIGKSRLARELQERVDALPGPVAWHAGRAPAYGDDVTFAAVAEMVRRRIRIDDVTEPQLAMRQLADMLRELVRDPDERHWLEPRIAVLLGRETAAAYDREELFAAWRRFFERVSDRAPTVLLFEDLQWADPSLLDFIEHLATWSRDHPILIVALARPELMDRRPGWGAALHSFTALHLERLPDASMAELLRARAPDLPEALVRQILEHAGGVPLYAVEVVRILADQAAGAPTPDRRVEPRPTGARQPSTIEVPDSLHGLIAARIDALPGPERRLLLAAGVLGRRFRPGALDRGGGRRSAGHPGTARWPHAPRAPDRGRRPRVARPGGGRLRAGPGARGRVSHARARRAARPAPRRGAVPRRRSTTRTWPSRWPATWSRHTSLRRTIPTRRASPVARSPRCAWPRATRSRCTCRNARSGTWSVRCALPAPRPSGRGCSRNPRTLPGRPDGWSWRRVTCATSSPSTPTPGATRRSRGHARTWPACC